MNYRTENTAHNEFWTILIGVGVLEILLSNMILIVIGQNLFIPKMFSFRSVVHLSPTMMLPQPCFTNIVYLTGMLSTTFKPDHE